MKHSRRNETNGLFSEKDFSLYYDLFQNSGIGQIVIDQNLNVIFANKQMFRSMQLPFYPIRGISFGSLFHCALLKPDAPEIQCGNVSNCRNCKLHALFQKSLRNRDNLQCVLSYSVQAKHHVIRKWFQLSTAGLSQYGHRYAQISFTDVSALKQRESYMREKLTLDPYTKALNKTSLLSALQEIIELNEKNATVSMIDFDNFKMLNDRYGHLAGDKILKVFSEIVHRHLHGRDIFGRYGGEEFIFVFFQTTPMDSLGLLKRIHDELQAHFSARLEIPVTFSAGVVYLEHGKREFSLEDLINEVDRLLYHAKSGGRGRAVSSLGETLFVKF